MLEKKVFGIRKCVDCAYYVPIDLNAGQCRRFPPVTGKSPIVMGEYDWCGEYIFGSNDEKRVKSLEQATEKQPTGSSRPKYLKGR